MVNTFFCARSCNMLQEVFMHLMYKLLDISTYIDFL